RIGLASCKSDWLEWRHRMPLDVRKVRLKGALRREFFATTGTSQRPSAAPCRCRYRGRGFEEILRELQRASLFAAVFRRAQLAWRFLAGPPVLEFQPWEALYARPQSRGLADLRVRSRPLQDFRRG